MTHPMPSPSPFVILAMPRAGTHYLEELLNEHPSVLSNGELLNPYDTNWLDKDRLLGSDRELLELAYLRYPNATNKKVTRVGCKINEPQFRERPGFFAELARWPCLKVILLVRRNTLESLRSLTQARQTRQWLKYTSGNDANPCVKLTVACCEAYFKTADEFHNLVARSFASTDLHVVEYESLLGEPSACLATIWGFLGIPAVRLSGATILKRQEARPLDQTIENFGDLRRHFAGGPYARFFEVGDRLNGRHSGKRQPALP
ncbi:nodulation protein NodH [Mesorhizobium loti]|uniref:sulfotransferase domain-containing protein n=1 Tax=Mesorhizobium TaxID=68287 RepID=UPI000BAE9E8F|nr:MULTISPECIES: sulfotransferase [Mesorhizobium]PBB14221.1 nodulation protein NodH [Mesorhizobium loti]PBC07303.1 nodulation protein NodH [Mesorhizobium sp. WSM3859]